jgi:hypothetical protein
MMVCAVLAKPANRGEVVPGGQLRIGCFQPTLDSRSPDDYRRFNIECPFSGKLLRSAQ